MSRSTAAGTTTMARSTPASGMTTNIAARLAAQAGDGETVLSATTRHRLGPDLLVEDLGVRELKNVETPMRLYRLG